MRKKRAQPSAAPLIRFLVIAVICILIFGRLRIAALTLRRIFRVVRAAVVTGIVCICCVRRIICVVRTHVNDLL